MSINPGYFLKEAAISFKRNWVMSLGAIITIFLSLLLIGGSMMFTNIANSLVENVESKVSIQIFIRDDANQDEVTALQDMLEQNAMVSTVNYTSKEQALDNFKETMKDSPDIIANLEDQNPLPASLDVDLVDSRQVEEVVALIKADPNFAAIADKPDNPEQSLKYGEQVVKRLFTFTRLVRVIGWVFVVMLGAVSLIFINNTIRLAIYSRRQEIGIMRLVGASNWFIRGPFILEGVFQALIGATLAIGALVTVQQALLPKLQDFVSFLPFNFTSVSMIQISVTLIIGGIVIGVLGSFIAMRRYLKV